MDRFIDVMLVISGVLAMLTLLGLVAVCVVSLVTVIS